MVHTKSMFANGELDVKRFWISIDYNFGNLPMVEKHNGVACIKRF
jgi:hypothetical protein